jgi:hypothetical protein
MGFQTVRDLARQKIYHQPGDRDYGSTRIDTRKGERWFCTVREAQGNG